MPGTVFLQGDKVELRNIEKEDLEFLRDGVNHPEVRVHMGNTRPQNLENEEDFFKHVVNSDDSVHFLICNEGEPMGIISIERKEKPANNGELGIWLHPEFHGEGFGTEAAELMIDYAFEQLNYHKIYARAHENNDASKKLWKKLDFKKEAELKDHVFLEGEHKNLIYYRMVEGERK